MGTGHQGAVLVNALDDGEPGAPRLLRVYVGGAHAPLPLGELDRMVCNVAGNERLFAVRDNRDADVSRCMPRRGYRGELGRHRRDILDQVNLACVLQRQCAVGDPGVRIGQLGPRPVLPFAPLKDVPRLRETAAPSALRLRPCSSRCGRYAYAC